ncbi:MAG TPA: chromate resistance protein ChrB domain-containing protein [Terriglobales bacterium]
MSAVPQDSGAPWLLLIFSLPAKRASERVQVWRKLKRHGALPLRSSGYVLPNNAINQERFEWLAAAIRKYKGEASVVQVHAIDDLPSEALVQRFVEARSRDYEALIRELQKIRPTAATSSSKVARLRNRFQEIATIDFFTSPLRGRVETLFDRLDSPNPLSGEKTLPSRIEKEFLDRTWMTRPRPGIDRVSSAWLIRRFVDPKGKFLFSSDPRQHPEAIPFDMFQQAGGFGHRGEDCTFETLRKEFRIRDRRVTTIAQIIHDADLSDGKFGRVEGVGLDLVLIGWAQQGVSDEELLRRGMELIAGLYDSLPEGGQK